MVISGFVSIPEWGRDSEREGGGVYPGRLRPQDAEEVVGKRRRHIWSALPGTQSYPILTLFSLSTCMSFVLSYVFSVITVTLILYRPLDSVNITHSPIFKLSPPCNINFRHGFNFRSTKILLHVYLVIKGDSA